MNETRPLTFTALDGLAFAAERGRFGATDDLPAMSAGEIGPLIEWSCLNESGLLPPPERSIGRFPGTGESFISALRSGQQQWVCSNTRRIGLFRLPEFWPEKDNGWIRFGLSAQRAAREAGFHPQIAAQFVGAMEEMISNIYEHSGLPQTGLVAFRGGSGEFEFAVADYGMGVLKSLHSCAEYRQLSDHGTALRMALTDGVSRFGTKVNRGHGFRPIFVGLANLSGMLRFRSGNHALTIDGQKFDFMSAKVAQKARMHGFLACVSCRSGGSLEAQ